jgi:hypothetical protein
MMGSCEIDFDIIKIEARRYDVQSVAVSCMRQSPYGSPLYNFFAWERCFLPNERFKNFRYSVPLPHGLFPSGSSKADDRKAALMIHVD